MTLDLCSTISQFHKCPLTQGRLAFSIVQMIPDALPPGAYSGSMVMMDQNNQEIVCIAFSLTLGSPTPNLSTIAKLRKPSLARSL